MAKPSGSEHYMRMAIALALKAEGMTSPNPIVGAVIVKGGKIVGKGFHKKCGGAHAEINALREAGSKARGATMYVTLEPCDHYGRTPPCTDSIIKSGIKRVVYGMKDPNPITNGGGIRRLRRSGIEVSGPVLEDEVRSINRPFIKFVTKNMPFVTLKLAESLDGKIAARTGDSKWITSEAARAYVHDLRAKVDAVMVGKNTFIKDDPTLLSRSKGARQPVRVVVGGQSKIPWTAKLLATKDESDVYFASAGKERVDLKKLLEALASKGIVSVLVEGGGELAASLLKDGLVDRVMFFIAPKIIGGRSAVTGVEGDGARNVRDAVSVKNIKVRRFGDDILIEGDL